MANDKNLAYIGREVPVSCNVLKPNAHQPAFKQDLSKNEHTFIAGHTGSGKTYLFGDIIEEIVRTLAADRGALIADPKGNLSTMNRPNADTDLINQWNSLTKDNIRPEAITNLTRWVPAGDAQRFQSSRYDAVFSLKAADLTDGALCFAYGKDLPPLSPQARLYRNVREQMRARHGDWYTLEDIINCISNEGEILGYKAQTVEALKTKVQALEDIGLIQECGVALNKVVREGHVSILNLSMSSRFTGRLLVEFLAEKTLGLRMQASQVVADAQASHTLVEEPPLYIPPFLFGIDEAHRFFPQSPVLCECITEGRSIGLTTLFVSQSANITPDLYKNLSHLYIGKLNYDPEINKMHAMLPVTRTPGSFREMVKGLQGGCFLYYHIDPDYEKKILVRPRRSLHLASTKQVNEREFFKPKPMAMQSAKSVPLPAPKPAPKPTGLEPITFSENFPKLQRAIFTTIRRHDTGYEIAQVRPITLTGNGMVGKARIKDKHAKTLPELDTEFLKNDTNRPTREDAIALLNSFYQTPISSDEKLTILILEWVK